MDLFKAILVETKNICTRTCWFCKYGQERQDDSRVEMDWKTIRLIVENLRDLEYDGRVSWFWINEPLMDKRMVEILRLTRDRVPKAFLSLITNGDLLTRESYATLRAAGLDALGVSAYDEKTMARAAEIADSRLAIIDMRSPGPGMIQNRAGNVRQKAEIFRPALEKYFTKSCERPFTMLTMNPRGQVVLCCDDMYSDVVMGDVHTQRLEEIWNGSGFRHYREALRSWGRAGLKLCENCSSPGWPATSHYPLSRSGAATQVPRASR